MEVKSKPPYISQETWNNWTRIKKNKKIRQNASKIKCSICLNPIKILSKWDKLHMGLSTVDLVNYSKLYCNHYFHNDCIDKWLDNNNTCPNCRSIIYY